MPIRLNRTESTWGIRYLLFQLAFLPSMVAVVLDFALPGWSMPVFDIVCWGINFCVVCGIFHGFLRDSMEYSLQNLKKVLLSAVVGFGVYWVLSMGLNVLLHRLFPQFYNVNDASIALLVGQDFPLMFVGTVLLVPFTEEMLYRALTFGVLYKRSRWLAYGVSVCLFCMIHVMGYVGRYEPLHLLVCFVQYIPAGLVLAGVYERSGSIFAPTLIHMAVNAIAILSMR